MIKTVAGAFFALCLAVTGAHAADEGIDYNTLAVKIPTETGDKIEVLELFWYGCPHCAHLEPKLVQWLKTMPDTAEFRRMPAIFGPRWAPHGRAYYAAELMGELDRFHQPLFDAMHVKKRRILTDEQLFDFAAEQGIDRDEFKKAYNSFAVEMKVRKALDVGQRARLDGVPAMLIDGTYTTSPSQAGGTTKMFRVIDALLAELAKEAPAEAAAGG